MAPKVVPQLINASKRCENNASCAPRGSFFAGFPGEPKTPSERMWPLIAFFDCPIGDLCKKRPSLCSCCENVCKCNPQSGGGNNRINFSILFWPCSQNGSGEDNRRFWGTKSTQNPPTSSERRACENFRIPSIQPSQSSQPSQPVKPASQPGQPARPAGHQSLRPPGIDVSNSSL